MQTASVSKLHTLCCISWTRHLKEVGKMQDDLTIKEAAKSLGVSGDTIRRRIKDGTIKAEMRPSKYGKPQYYINPVEISGAVRHVEVARVEHSMTPEQFAGSMQQAMQQTVQQAIEPLHKEIAALQDTMQQNMQQDQQAVEQAVEPLHKEIAALRAEIAERDERRDQEIVERMKQLIEEKPKSFWRRLFG